MSPSRTCIRIAAATDREQTELRTLVESGWPTDKVPESVKPYWDVCSELRSHEGLLFIQYRVVIPTALRLISLKPQDIWLEISSDCKYRLGLKVEATVELGPRVKSL